MLTKGISVIKTRDEWIAKQEGYFTPSGCLTQMLKSFVSHLYFAGKGDLVCVRSHGQKAVGRVIGDSYGDMQSYDVGNMRSWKEPRASQLPD